MAINSEISQKVKIKYKYIKELSNKKKYKFIEWLNFLLKYNSVS